MLPPRAQTETLVPCLGPNSYKVFVNCCVRVWWKGRQSLSPAEQMICVIRCAVASDLNAHFAFMHKIPLLPQHHPRSVNTLRGSSSCILAMTMQPRNIPNFPSVYAPVQRLVELEILLNVQQGVCVYLKPAYYWPVHPNVQYGRRQILLSIPF